MPRAPKMPTLPPKEALILELLSERAQSATSLELVTASKGAPQARHRVCDARADGGEGVRLLTPRECTAGGRRTLPRRVYEATALGRRVLAAWAQVARLLPEFAR